MPITLNFDRDRNVSKCISSGPPVLLLTLFTHLTVSLFLSYSLFLAVRQFPILANRRGGGGGEPNPTRGYKHSSAVLSSFARYRYRRVLCLTLDFSPAVPIAVFNIHRLLLLLLSAARGSTGGARRTAGRQRSARPAVGLVAAAVAVLIIVSRSAFLLLQLLHCAPRYNARYIRGDDLAGGIVAGALARAARARLAQQLFVVLRLLGEVVVLHTVGDALAVQVLGYHAVVLRVLQILFPVKKEKIII
jgi:hypothetical protein